jgi:hypothetical protein
MPLHKDVTNDATDSAMSTPGPLGDGLALVNWGRVWPVRARAVPLAVGSSYPRDWCSG